MSLNFTEDSNSGNTIDSKNPVNTVIEGSGVNPSFCTANVAIDTSNYKYLRHKPLCANCWVSVALSIGVYLLMDIIDMYRGVMWFLICVIFSFANILANQYIPKERRNEIC